MSTMIWESWTNDTANSTTNCAWENWNLDATTSVTMTDNSACWDSWQDCTPTGTTNENAWLAWNKEHQHFDIIYVEPISEKSHSERMQSQIWSQWSQHLSEARTEERKDAEVRAKELLGELIGKEQLKIYEETGRLFVKGKKFDYIVRKGSTVLKIEKDKVVDMCIHISQTYPPTDNVIGIKLAIEAEEDNVLQLANKSNHRNRPSELPLAACM